MVKTNITFVTAFMNIYETPFQNKDVEWRFRHFKKIAETGIQLGVFCSPDCSEYMEQLVAEFPNDLRLSLSLLRSFSFSLFIKPFPVLLEYSLQFLK
jgi:hypothetical protein